MKPRKRTPNDRKKKKKLRDGRTKTANVDAVDNLICSLDSDGAVGMDTENRVRTLSLDSDLGEKRIFNLGEFVDAVADSIIVVAAAIVFLTEVFVDTELSFVS